MDLKFEFRHENISIVELHKIGIRSTKWLEEVILGESFWNFEEINNETLVFATGFTLGVIPLVVLFKLDENYVIYTLDVKRATIQNIKNDFCKFCLKN